MGKEGKVNRRRGFGRRVRSEDRGSDDSDEDYVIEDEVVVSDEEDFEGMEDSLDEYALEETFGGSVEEEDVMEESEDGFRKIVKSQRRGGRKAGRKTSRKRKMEHFMEEEGEDDEDYVIDEEEEYIDENDDINDDDDDDDFEFTLEEVDDLVDEHEDHMVKKKKKYNVMVGERSMQKRGFVKVQRRKRRRKSRVSKNPSVLKHRNHGRLKNEGFKPDDLDNKDFLDKVPVNRKKRTTSGLKARQRTYVLDSDSDFVSSRSSDDDYTISEEEREPAKKRSKLFGNLKKSLRSSTSTNGMQENGVTGKQKKNLGRKGKEKVKEIKEEVVKHVCGICLSEEDKRRSRGMLDCCSHFYCFTCIMEWSKVESRCPLCKQRFKTITKNGRSTVDLRNVVIEVPERDQVYQPTEEEIRSAIDPYESVICSECHEGGDDGLMLLCDLCDSPAHTYCVGLGRQVPEGNWYCDGCRPVALGSSSTQAEDQRMTGNDTFDRTPPPLSNTAERSGPGIDSSPCLAFSQVFGNMSSPRFPTGDRRLAASPVSGVGAPTLSMRRQLHRRIQSIISMNFMAGRMDGVSASNLHSELLNSRIGQDRETTIRNSTAYGIGSLQNMLLGERSLTNAHSSTSIHDMNLSQFRGQMAWNRISTTLNRPVNLALRPERQETNALPVNEQLHPYNGTSHPELQGMSALPVNEQLHPYNGRSSTGFDGNFSFHGVGEQNGFYALKEQLQSMVKTHLRNLSHDTDLGHDTYKEVVRSSTHTILAACGLEHRRSEVQHVPPPSTCIHADRLSAGEMSMMKDVCSYCFNSFVRDVVKRILDAKLSQWLSLGL